jgi:hypothetical protein
VRLGEREGQMPDTIKELRDKAVHYREEATTALNEKEREILLGIATDSDHLANQLEAMRKRP